MKSEFAELAVGSMASGSIVPGVNCQRGGRDFEVNPDAAATQTAEIEEAYRGGTQ